MVRQRDVLKIKLTWLQTELRFSAPRATHLLQSWRETCGMNALIHV